MAGGGDQNFRVTDDLEQRDISGTAEPNDQLPVVGVVLRHPAGEGMGPQNAHPGADRAERSVGMIAIAVFESLLDHEVFEAPWIIPRFLGQGDRVLQVFFAACPGKARWAAMRARRRSWISSST